MIIQEQSFIEGRDQTLEPATNVHEQLADGEKTGIKTLLVNQ